MEAVIDHLVLWVEDPLRSVEFYRDVVGFEALRVEEFQEGTVLFPSVRLSPHSILDLIVRAGAPVADAMTGAEGSAGHRLNHVCFTVGRDDFVALRNRLRAHGVTVPNAMTDSFGAQGTAPETFYFSDPDGNVLEARYYAPLATP